MSLHQSFRACILALTIVTMMVATFAIAAPAAPAKGNATAGQAVYKVKCVVCHKADGSGGFKVSGNPTPNWKLKKTWDATRTDAFMRDCIVNGKIKSGMVAWGKTNQLKPQQVEDMIAYIRTFKATAK